MLFLYMLLIFTTLYICHEKKTVLFGSGIRKAAFLLKDEVLDLPNCPQYNLFIILHDLFIVNNGNKSSFRSHSIVLMFKRKQLWGLNYSGEISVNLNINL